VEVVEVVGVVGQWRCCCLCISVHELKLIIAKRPVVFRSKEKTKRSQARGEERRREEKRPDQTNRASSRTLQTKPKNKHFTGNNQLPGHTNCVCHSSNGCRPTDLQCALPLPSNLAPCCFEASKLLIK